LVPPAAIEASAVSRADLKGLTSRIYNLVFRVKGLRFEAYGLGCEVQRVRQDMQGRERRKVVQAEGFRNLGQRCRAFRLALCQTQSPELPRDSPHISPSRPTRNAICRWKSRDPVKCATRRPVLADMEKRFQSSSIDQNRSSANWPLAKILQRYINHVTRRLGLTSYVYFFPRSFGTKYNSTQIGQITNCFLNQW